MHAVYGPKRTLENDYERSRDALRFIDEVIIIQVLKYLKRI